MAYFFINLKRFDVPRSMDGLCPIDDSQKWITHVIQNSVELGLGKLPGVNLNYLLPEGLVSTARRVLEGFPREESGTITIGCQGVHWQDVEKGKNFGAFTSSLPAKAAAALGCQWAMIGHSEERRAKFQVIEAYDAHLSETPASYHQAQAAINGLIRDEVLCALRANLNVLLCVGETAAERGEGDFADQQPRIQAILENQLLTNLQVNREYLDQGKIIIGYEPIWAIGPGKIPPGADYIAFVSAFIKKTVSDRLGFEPAVIYGGGLKEENAAMIAGVTTIDGGLVALTRFSGEIGFNVPDLKIIIQNFIQKGGVSS